MFVMVGKALGFDALLVCLVVSTGPLSNRLLVSFPIFLTLLTNMLDVFPAPPHAAFNSLLTVCLVVSFLIGTSVTLRCRFFLVQSLVCQP